MAGSGAARPSLAAVPRAPVGPRPVSRTALMERLQAVIAEQPPADALQPAVQAIVEDFRATAGAVCSFDVRHGILRLTAEHGLSDEGCRRLRTIKPSDPGSWDIPLHGVLNRRAYLIEKASENRYVPSLVDTALPIRSVVCLPLFDGAMPLGSLILVTVGARTLGEVDVRQLGEAGQVLAKLIEAMRRDPGQPEAAVAAPPAKRIDVAAVIAERDALRAELDARGGERDAIAEQLRAGQLEIGRLRGALANAETAVASLTIERERAQQEAFRVPELATSMAAAERERTRLTEALETARAAVVDRERRLDAVESARIATQTRADQLESELAGLRADAASRVTHAEAVAVATRTDLGGRLAGVEAALADAQGVVAVRDREAADLRAQVTAAAAREAALQAELGTVAGRAHDLSSASSELHAVRETLARAEAGAAEARAAAEASAAALAGAQAERDRLAQQLAEEHARAAGASSALDAAAAERAALADAVDTARADLARIHETVAAAQRDAAEARETAAGLERSLADERARAATLASEREQLHAAVDAAQRREAQLREEIVRREADRTAADQADVRTALDSARAAEAAYEAARAEAAAATAELATARDELQRLHAHDDAMATEVAGLRVALDAARDDAQRATAALTAAETAAHARADADAVTLQQHRTQLAEHESAAAILQRRLAEQEQALGQREQALADLRSQLDAEVARRAESQDRVQALESELGDLRHAAQSAGAEEAAARAATIAQAAAQAAALAAAQQESQRLAAELQSARHAAEASATSLAHAETQRTELEATLAREREAEARREARVTELDATLAGLRRELADVRHAQDGERDALETARRRERTELEGQIAALEHQLEQSRQSLAGATAKVDHLTATLATEQASSGALAAELAQAQATADGLASARDRAQADATERAEELARLLEERDAAPAVTPKAAAPQPVASGPAAPSEPVDEEQPTPPNDEPPGPSGGTRQRIGAEETAPAGGGVVLELPLAAAMNLPVVVIDAADRWGDTVKDRAVRWCAPDAVPAVACGPEDVERIVVNLAAPGALTAMVDLRKAGVTTPFWGCLVDASGTKALALGPVEVLEVPLDPEQAMEALGPASGRAGRVITAGADVDALMSLRQALSRRQASVSMAWDAKQVVDLLAVAQPHALVADLDLPRRDGYAIVAAVAGCKVPPRLLLVGGDEHTTTALAGITRDPAQARLLQPLATVLAGLAGRVEAVPQDRRVPMSRPVRATK